MSEKKRAFLNDFSICLVLVIEFEFTLPEAFKKIQFCKVQGDMRQLKLILHCYLVLYSDSYTLKKIQK